MHYTASFRFSHDCVFTVCVKLYMCVLFVECKSDKDLNYAELVVKVGNFQKSRDHVDVLYPTDWLVKIAL